MSDFMDKINFLRALFRQVVQQLKKYENEAAQLRAQNEQLNAELLEARSQIAQLVNACDQLQLEKDILERQIVRDVFGDENGLEVSVVTGNEIYTSMTAYSNHDGNESQSKPHDFSHRSKRSMSLGHYDHETWYANEAYGQASSKCPKDMFSGFFRSVNGITPTLRIRSLPKKFFPVPWKQ